MTNFEIRILNYIRDIITPFFDKVLELITIFGEQNILILLLIGVYFIHSKKDGQRIAFAIFSSLLLNNIVKGLVQRIRPFKHPLNTFDATRIETATGYSFPSGHSQGAAVSYTSIALTFKKKWLWITVSILIFLIGVSRIGLGVHYPSDVIVGILLGILVAIYADKLFRKFENNFNHQLILYFTVVTICLPFVFIFLRKDYEDAVLYKDFYAAFAFFLGYIAAVTLEKKYVDFDDKNSLKLKIIRAIIAIIIAGLFQFGLKVVLPKDSIPMDMLRYFLTALATIGLFPLFAKKWLFKKS